MPMTQQEAADLVELEYEIVAIDVELSTLSFRFSRTSLPGKDEARETLSRMRSTLTRLLKSIDGPVSDAVAQHEVGR